MQPSAPPTSTPVTDSQPARPSLPAHASHPASVARADAWGRGRVPMRRVCGATARELWARFAVRRLYGPACTQADDEGATQVVVITSGLNHPLVGGRNKFGRGLSLSGQPF